MHEVRMSWHQVVKAIIFTAYTDTQRSWRTCHMLTSKKIIASQVFAIFEKHSKHHRAEEVAAPSEDPASACVCSRHLTHDCIFGVSGLWLRQIGLCGMGPFTPDSSHSREACISSCMSTSLPSVTGDAGKLQQVCTRIFT